MLVTLATLSAVAGSGTSEVVAPCATTASPFFAVTVPVRVKVTDPPTGMVAVGLHALGREGHRPLRGGPARPDQRGRDEGGPTDDGGDTPPLRRGR